jgi:LytR cell envelope-related transcriptional attenuator
MASSRTYLSILEQSRRHRRELTIGGVLLLLAIGGTLLMKSAPQPKPSVQSSAPVPSPRGRVTVEVLNGTRRQGAARTATRMLRGHGLDVVFLGNSDSLSPATQVLARRGDSLRARYVAAALGAGAVRVEIDTFRRVDVSVILGEDFRPKLELHP